MAQLDMDFRALSVYRLTDGDVAERLKALVC
jgi:hypothetical protein